MGKQKSVILLFVSMLVSLGLTQLACNTTDRPVTTPAFVLTQGPTNTPCGYPGNTCTPTDTATSTPTDTPTATATGTPCTSGVLGNGSTESASAMGSGDMLMEPVTPGSSVTLQGLMMQSIGGYGYTIEGAVYSDNGGKPLNRLAYTPAITVLVTGFNYASLNTNLVLTGGQQYWLLVHGDYLPYTGSGGSGGFYSPSPSSYGSLPASLTAVDFQAAYYLIGLYGVYCP
jgi:hypothetical protein